MKHAIGPQASKPHVLELQADITLGLTDRLRILFGQAPRLRMQLMSARWAGPTRLNGQLFVGLKEPGKGSALTIGKPTIPDPVKE